MNILGARWWVSVLKCGLYPQRSDLYDQVMRTLHFALPSPALAMLLQMSVGRCDAGAAPSVSVVKVPLFGSPMATDGELFAAKLNPQGSQFLYVTYLPGSAAVRPAIAADPRGNTYVAGQTQSGHAFVAKLSPDGSALLYNTVLAGSD